MAKSMTDEERYGKVGAEIRRLDPEAYKNRADKSASANLKLLKELREKAKGTPARKMSSEEFVREYESSDTPAGRTVKTETKVTEEAPAVRRSGRGKTLPANYRPKVGSGRYDDPTSTYGERVTAPFRKLGDIFGLRKEEKVMRDMGVSREEARRRLEEKEDVEEMRRGGRVKKMAGGGSTTKPFTKGPQGPRRYPGQNEAARERRQEEMSRKMKEARERFDRSIESDTPGYKRGGMAHSGASKRADGIAKKGKTRGRMI